MASSLSYSQTLNMVLLVTHCCFAFKFSCSLHVPRLKIFPCAELPISIPYLPMYKFSDRNPFLSPLVHLVAADEFVSPSSRAGRFTTYLETAGAYGMSVVGFFFSDVGKRRIVAGAYVVFPISPGQPTNQYIIVVQTTGMATTRRG